MAQPLHERARAFLTTFADISTGERKLVLPEGYPVVLGIPPRSRKDPLFGGDELFVPIRPHILRVSNLRIATAEPMRDIVVLLAHGKRSEDNKWEFGLNRQPVVDTVLAYNRFARRSGYPSIEAVLVCNPGHNKMPAADAEKLHEAGIIFPTHDNIFPHVTYQDGEVNILVSTSSPDGFANTGRRLPLGNVPQDTPPTLS